MMFQKYFYIFKTTITIWFSFQTSFFLIKCAQFLLKIEEGFNIDDYKKKAFEIGKFHFKMHLNIFVSNVFLILKMMNF